MESFVIQPPLNLLNGTLTLIASRLVLGKADKLSGDPIVRLTFAVKSVQSIKFSERLAILEYCDVFACPVTLGNGPQDSPLRKIVNA